MLDNCQHVLLGCCKEALNFFTKIGSAGSINFCKDISFVSHEGKTLRISSSPLPAPLHLLPSILKTNYLSAGNKFQLTRLMARIAVRAPGKQESAAEYLKSLSCPDKLIVSVVEPILASALNEDLASASAKYARMVLMATLTGSRNAYEMGIPKVALSDLITKPALDFLSAKNCRVRTAARVGSLNIQGDRISSITLASGEEIVSDYFVSAVPPDSLSRLGYNTEAVNMTWHPIIGVHLFSDAPEPDFERACIIGEPFQWVFNKSKDLGLGCTYLQAVASAADAIAGMTKDELIKLAVRAVSRVAPEVGVKSFERAIVYRSKRATFSTGTASDMLRPENITPISNLFLAGDWTDTKWPATIEGAVRSGLAAARAILSS